MSADWIQVFTTPDMSTAQWSWGWRCFACCEEEDELPTSETAATRGEWHAERCTKEPRLLLMVNKGSLAPSTHSGPTIYADGGIVKDPNA